MGEIINVLKRKEEIKEMAELISATIIKNTRPVDDELSTVKAFDEFGKEWMKFHIARRNIEGRRRGRFKNSPIVFNRSELLALKMAEKECIPIIIKEKRKRSAGKKQSS